MSHRRNVPAFKYKRTKQATVRSKHAGREGANIQEIITQDPLTKMQIKTKEKMPDELRPLDNLAYTFPPYFWVGIIVAAFVLLFLLFF